MKNFLKITLALAISVASFSSFGARQTTMLPGSVKNFELPHFDDKSGIKEWELFGDTAKYINESRIDITKIKLDLYEGKVEAKHRATITSPTAQVNPNTKISQSDDILNVSAKEFDMSGKKWTWYGDKRFVEVFSDVKISVKPRTPKDSPTIFTSQYANLDYRNHSNVFELKTNVSVKNDEMQLKCDFLHAKSSKKNARGVSDIIAKGNVEMIRGKHSTFAQVAEIDPEGIVVLTGSPKITDLPSKSELLGDRIILNKDKKTIESFSSKKLRAIAIIFHADENKKEQKITIISDKISMSQKDNQNIFNFNGNVNIIADDFTAKCENLQALSISKENEKPTLEYIRGNGDIRFENSDGIATSKAMEIIPEKQEIWLSENVQLRNPKRGTTLSAEAMAFFKNQNKGLALTSPNKKDSFVVVKMAETPTFNSIADGKTKSKGKTTTTIKSRKLHFSKTETTMDFVFIKDVIINSDDIQAKCQKMSIFAETDEKGSSSPKKIIAQENVSLQQKGYSASAEIATIYPRLDAKGDNKQKIHKYIELATDPQNPLLRPTITLSKMRAFTISETENLSNIKKKTTVIKSDKQWLTSTAKQDKYYFEGNISVTGTNMDATCENMEVIIPNKPKAKKEISQIIMRKNVKFNQQLKEATCDRADIFPIDNIVELTEGPIVIDREDNSRAYGHKITYNNGTRKIQIESDPNAPQPATSQFDLPSLEGDDVAPKRATIKIDTNLNKRKRNFNKRR